MEKVLIRCFWWIPLLYVIENIFNINMYVNFIPVVLIIAITITRVQISKIKLFIVVFLFAIIQILKFKSILNSYYLIDFIIFIWEIIFFTNKNNLKKLEQNAKYYINEIFTINLIIISIAIIRFCSESGWVYVWEGKQFKAFLDSPHDASYFFIFVQLVFIFISIVEESVIKKRFSTILSLVCVILSLFTNARTPFMISLIILAYYLYKFINNKLIWGGYFILGILVFLMVNDIHRFVDINNIPIINKFIDTYQSGNISNSRDIIWGSVISEYNINYSIKDKILGKGFGYSWIINKYNINRSIWSHNDFLEVLISSGIIGILIYLYAILKIFLLDKNILISICFILIAYFNGLFVYFGFVVGLPLILLSLHSIINYRRNNKEKT